MADKKYRAGGVIVISEACLVVLFIVSLCINFIESCLKQSSFRAVELHKRKIDRITIEQKSDTKFDC